MSSSYFFKYTFNTEKTGPIIVSLSTDFQLWDIGNYLDIFYTKDPFYVNNEDPSITNKKIPTIRGWTLISIVNKNGGKIYRYRPGSGAAIDYILRNNIPIMPVFEDIDPRDIMVLMINAKNDPNKIIDKPRVRYNNEKHNTLAYIDSENEKARRRRREGKEILADGWGRDLGEHEHAPEAGSILSALRSPFPPPGLSMPPRELAIRPGRRRNENEPGDDEFFTPPSSPPSSSKGGKKNRRTKTTRRGKTTRRTTKRKNRRTNKK